MKSSATLATVAPAISCWNNGVFDGLKIWTDMRLHYFVNVTKSCQVAVIKTKCVLLPYIIPLNQQFGEQSSPHQTADCVFHHDAFLFLLVYRAYPNKSKIHRWRLRGWSQIILSLYYCNRLRRCSRVSGNTQWGQ